MVRCPRSVTRILITRGLLLGERKLNEGLANKNRRWSSADKGLVLKLHSKFLLLGLENLDLLIEVIM